MGIREIFGWGSGAEATSLPGVDEALGRSVPQSLPSLPVTVVGSAQAGIMDSSAGGSSLTWANYDARPFAAGYPRYGWWGMPGSEISREQALASSIALDMLATNPIIAALVEQLAVYAVGTNGLTLSSRPDHAALGISPEAARELSHSIETAWAAWSGNPVECDASGRHSLHQLATAAFKSYLLTGESLFILDWKLTDASTRTKVNLLDPRQLCYEITRVTDGGNILQGVQFDKNGRVFGYWLRKFVLGSFSTAPQPIFVKARTSWGRARVGHLFDLVASGQIRGISPLAAALTPAKSREVLNEYTLAAALIQSMVAITVESDLDPKSAIGSMAIADQLQPPPGMSPDVWMQAKQAYYEAVKINLAPGAVTHLMKGDKLHLNRSQAPNASHETFDRALVRQAAKAAGASYEDVSGDFSQTSFSASRLAMELPWRVTKRRRSAIVEPFYRAAFSAWLEEACETGRVKLPAGAPAFWENPTAYANAVWRGDSKPVADPLKAAQADVVELQNGLSTLEIKLGERGLDLEETLAQQKSEKEQRARAGLPYPTPSGASVQVDDAEDDPALK